jgi:hypothetical protein
MKFNRPYLKLASLPNYKNKTERFWRLVDELYLVLTRELRYFNQTLKVLSRCYLHCYKRCDTAPSMQGFRPCFLSVA